MPFIFKMALFEIGVIIIYWFSDYLFCFKILALVSLALFFNDFKLSFLILKQRLDVNGVLLQHTVDKSSF